MAWSAKGWWRVSAPTPLDAVMALVRIGAQLHGDAKVEAFLHATRKDVARIAVTYQDGFASEFVLVGEAVVRQIMLVFIPTTTVH
jgi:hypothetical protein